MNTWFKLSRTDRQSPLTLNFSTDSDIQLNALSNSLEHSIKAIENISKAFAPPYNLLMSGGIDSQSMAYAWLLSGIDFNIVHYSYDNWNQHDTDSVLKFVEKHDIKNKLDIKNFKIFDFLCSDYLKENSIRYDCASPQILTYIQLIEQTKGTVILAGNNIQLDTAGLNYSVAGLYRYQAQTKKTLIPLFHLHDPNFGYSLFQPQTNWRKLSLEDSYALRVKLYKDAGFKIYPQASKKTGFEKIKLYFDDEIISPQERLKWRSKLSKRPFDIMFRYRLFDIIGDYLDSVKLEHHPMINRLINGTEHENTT